MTENSFKSHLTILEKSSSLFASRPAFRLPQLEEGTRNVERWKDITYQQFHHDVERVARHWIKTFRADEIPSGDVVGLWLSGWLYSDVVQIYGISRAGYIPQLFSLKLPDPSVVLDLLKKANARALIYEPSFEINLDKSHVLFYKPARLDHLGDVDHEPLSPLPPVIHGDEIAFVFHTSGSTSGSPRLVPWSYKWLDNTVREAEKLTRPRDPNHLDVRTWMGSTCHTGQTRMFIGSFQHGACTVKPTQVAFSSQELVDMVERCGLNRLTQFPTYLGMHLRNSYSNPKLLALLQSFDEIFYGGSFLGKEEENWAYKNGMLLKNYFGSTECGPMLLSIGGRGSNASLLRPPYGVSYAFFPVDSANQDSEATGVVLELVVLSDSPNCPHPSLCSPADGHFHTGDLFEEAALGCYVSRGRNDDWIKSENALRCDTRSIEDNVRSTCSDLVSECVVVGNGRPSPALFVEPARDDIDPTKLKQDILQRTHEFHARRYIHERISTADMVIVVDRGTLPRTAVKGNIRRRTVEEAFKDKLHEAYSTL